MALLGGYLGLTGENDKAKAVSSILDKGEEALLSKEGFKGVSASGDQINSWNT